MTKKILKFFDRLEDKTRSRLSRNPLLYALLGGIGIVLFWRGIWHGADELNLSSLSSIIIGLTILLLSGVFVSAFIGNSIIISGIRGDKKLDEKTADEIQAEEQEIENLKNSISRLEKKIDHLETDIHQE
jgi:low affinity Fe/Cu permease